MMAVVQISRIQLRRGKKNTNTGMPQLASGEMGWAIDTQELYIGNGAVSEGAPAVGNTKVLTEHDNILSLANQYTYKPTDNLWGTTTLVSRTLQNRLDDFVSVASFGALGDGTDQTIAIQNAINNLYLNQEVQNRVILWFPAGNYVVSSTLQIPSYAVLKGAGKDKTIITANNCDLLQTIHYNPLNPSEQITTLNQPRYIEISGMTLASNNYANQAMIIRSCVESIFKDLKLQGVWTIGSTTTTHKAINLICDSDAIICHHNYFEDIDIDNFNYAVYSDYDIKGNIFSSLRVQMAQIGIAFGVGTLIGTVGQTTGPSSNFIENSSFDQIDRQGFIVSNGTYNESRNNKYYNVGNDNAGNAIAVYPVVQFDVNNNISVDDYFDRYTAYTDNNPLSAYYNLEYVPEISGDISYSIAYKNSVPIGYVPTNQPLLKFPAKSGTLYIDYLYKEASQKISRAGTLEVHANLDSNLINISDSYDYIGDPIYSASLTFGAALAKFGTGSGNDTIVINAINLAPVSSDSFHYNIRVKT